MLLNYHCYNSEHVMQGEPNQKCRTVDVMSIPFHIKIGLLYLKIRDSFNLPLFLCSKLGEEEGKEETQADC